MRTRIPALVLALAVASGLLAGCDGGADPEDGDSSKNSADIDDRVVVAQLSKSRAKAMCAAMTAEIESFVGEAEDENDEVPADGQELCYSARGNGGLDYALGMVRVHEFDEDDIDAYERLRRDDPDGKQTECLLYTELSRDEDERDGAGVGEFRDAETGEENAYCVASTENTSVASFAVKGASVVLEIEVRGEYAEDPDDVSKLRDTIIDEMTAD